ncbi:MAG: zinc-dependent metalloprotease [Bacteroidales bacterium]|nr:zinc-dependent metalloprotease [Bacteroidales bacterium]
MKFRIAAICLAAFLCAFPSYSAVPEQKKDDAKKTEQASETKKETSYEKFFKNVTDSTKGAFVSFYKAKGNKVYMEFSRKNVGRRFLAGSTIKSVSSPMRVDIGYKYEDPMMLQIELEDSIVVLNKPNAGVTVTNGDPRLEAAAKTNFTPILYKRIPVKAFTPDSSSFIFDITEMLKDIVNRGVVNPPKDKSAYSVGAMRCFDDNASIDVKQNAEIKIRAGIFTLLAGEVTVQSTASFLLLPEEKMAPRVRDSRIGVFATRNKLGGNVAMYDLSADEDGMKPFALANRWKLEPTDLAAWQRGEKVTVKKPIVWYVDNTFPAAWVPSIKKGVLAWNAAFEKIGLKDVMQVRDFPTPEEDPEFDPDNLKYSCIRFVASPTANAMGPSWVDPTTGEILNASVLVYNDILRLLNNWRFVLTAQVDERVRARRMPQDVIDESMVYVISHEIGHTLGLMHNMGASAAYPVEKLRDPAFTAQNGTTPSIMDYARFNYVAQPEDKDVRLTPPDLGVYDLYAIEWLYKPVPDAKDMWEEAAVANRLIDAHAGDPLFRYGPQQSSTFYDPSARTEDLGDDPVKAGDYGIANLKYILPNINAWIEGDDDRSHRTQLYDQLVNQYLRYLNNVLNQVGGIYLNDVKDGTPGTPVQAVPKDVQKASLHWVMDQVRDCGNWINAPELTGSFELHTDLSNSIANNIARSLMAGIASDVVLSSHVSADGGYTPAEFYDDVFEEVFASSLKRKALTSEEKTFQRTVVTGLTKTSSSSALSLILSGGLRMDDLSAYPTLDELILTQAVDRDMLDRFGDRLREIEAYYGEGAVGAVLTHEGLLRDDCFGESKGYYQRSVNTSAIDESAAYKLQLLRKINDLVKSRRKGGPAADRAHYDYLYSLTSAALTD